MATDKKREAIIDAAMKRFAHFGVPKTTMNEISEDLGISKASLYYYFPDKLRLYIEVINTILNEAEANKPALSSDPFKSMEAYLNARVEYILRYQNILDYMNSFVLNPDENIKKLLERAYEMETSRITEILNQGISMKVFTIKTPEFYGNLLFNTLTGLRLYYLKNKPNYIINKELLEDLLLHEKALGKIFLKGLTV